MKKKMNSISKAATVAFLHDGEPRTLNDIAEGISAVLGSSASPSNIAQRVLRLMVDGLIEDAGQAEREPWRAGRAAQLFRITEAGRVELSEFFEMIDDLRAMTR